MELAGRIYRILSYRKSRQSSSHMETPCIHLQVSHIQSYTIDTTSQTTYHSIQTWKIRPKLLWSLWEQSGNFKQKVLYLSFVC